MYKILLLLFISLSLSGRENPFLPAKDASDISITTNQIMQIPKLKRASLSLPSTARVIESVEVKYKNLDGSISSKKVDIHNSIDWHLPIFITQSFLKQEQKKKLKPKLKVSYKKIASLKFIGFYQAKRDLKIVTKDKLLRDFLLVRPQRIVLDFKRDIDIRSYANSGKKRKWFKDIKIGTHDGYYRVVIELDGYYKYRYKKIKEGYIFTLQ